MHHKSGGSLCNVSPFRGSLCNVSPFRDGSLHNVSRVRNTATYSDVTAMRQSKFESHLQDVNVNVNHNYGKQGNRETKEKVDIVICMDSNRKHISKKMWQTNKQKVFLWQLG